jgi:hypothetical protein
MAAPHIVVEFTTKVAIARCQFAGFRRRELRPQQLVFQLLNSVTLACKFGHSLLPSQDVSLPEFGGSN